MKKLKDLTKEEYIKMKDVGILHAIYPKATGDYTKDLKNCQNDKFKVGNYLKKTWYNGSVDWCNITKIDGNDFYSSIFYRVTPKNFENYSTSKFPSRFIDKLPHERYKTVKINESDFFLFLKEEAIKRYPVGSNVDQKTAYDGKGDTFRINSNNTDVRIDIHGNINVAIDGCGVFNSEYNKWAEIIKSDEICIGDHVIKFNDNEFEIGCKKFSKKDLLTVANMNDFLLNKGMSAKFHEDGELEFEYGGDIYKFDKMLLRKILNKLD
jgi:hypothetical protein